MLPASTLLPKDLKNSLFTPPVDIHEPPSLNWQNEQKLLPGMIITIEPGIYLNGKFGFRYENTIYIGQEKLEVLTI